MSCSMEKPVKKSGENFPDGYSIEMSFYTSVGNSREEFASGYWNPISVGDQIFQGSSESSMPVSKSSLASSGLYANISYKISLILRYDARRIAPFDISSSGIMRVEISAEGIYDAETGSLCMVGCRLVGLNNQNLENDTMDCEICVNLQFSSLNAKKDEVDITGSIISLRDKSDSLHFESVYLLYVKTHPGVLPFISPLMLVVLTLGHMMVLLLNFEAWFFQSQNRQTVLLGSGGWPEVFVAMVAFVLQFRLFKLSCELGTEEQRRWHRNAVLEACQYAATFTLGRLDPGCRVVPHAYDLYRAYNYADHEADFYSIAWNVSIPLGCIFFMVILYFQQRFGAFCFDLRRFRVAEGYEKVLALAGEE
ncbi:hypothetical protein EZV62_008255 [Acer yangbiense]|uniref:RING-type E3 ubiquitin transferase n=1 Tax=Acer yangbiense TaxID=1000413 RepID=A0A5C7ICC0_9ROSI|nr:hypothetical protein EZV62_008255 [Acer yangbiense]